jgi:hypothetical protein
MISNERKWPSQNRPYQPYKKPYPVQRQMDSRYEAPQQPRPYVREDTIKSAEIQIERKHFLVMLKENPRGRFLRISEEVAGRMNSIIVPAAGFADFQKLLGEMVEISEKTPLPSPLPEA